MTHNFVPQTKWTVLVVLFLIFSFVSLWGFLNGKMSCGCFGWLDISPSTVLLIDLLALVFLGLVRPSNLIETFILDARQNLFGSPQQIGQISALFVCALIFSLLQPSANTFFHQADTNEIATTPINLGEVILNSPVDFEVTLFNKSDYDTHIVGVQKSCTCLATGDLTKAKIPRRSSIDIDITLHPRKTGDFKQRLLFYLDTPRQYVVASDVYFSVSGE